MAELGKTLVGVAEIVNNLLVLGKPLDHKALDIGHWGDLPATPLLGDGNSSYTYVWFALIEINARRVV